MNCTARPEETRGAPAMRPVRHPVGAPLVLLLLLMPLFLGGCGGNVTSGGFGDVEVQVSSDAVADGVLAAILAARAEQGPALVGKLDARMGTRAVAAPDGPAGTQAVAQPDAPAGTQAVAASDAWLDVDLDPARLQGTVTVTVRSFLREGRTRWIEITDGPQEVVLPLDDPTPVVVARASLQEGEYEAVRTVFGRVRVQVTGGLEIGGAPFVGEIQIPVVGGGLLLAEERPFVVERRRPLPLLLELHAPRWLPLANRDSRTVPEADFRREFRVRTPGR